MAWSRSRTSLGLTYRALVCTALLHVALPTAVRAQSTDDNSAFDFSLPGARSRGIAGAFVAIADDATSVYSNPAGLTGLFRPEVSIEARHWNLKSRAINGGHAFGRPTNIGIDTVAGVTDEAFTNGVNGLSFLSFAYPKERWAFGAFHHQLARYEMNRQIDGVLFDCRGGLRPNPPYCEHRDGVERLFPQIQAFDLSIRSTGAAVAYDWAERVSMGIAVQYFDFNLVASGRVFAARGDQRFLPSNFSDPANLELLGERSGDDHAVGVNAGVLWEISQHWTAGGSFRKGPTFHYLAQTTTGPANLAEQDWVRVVDTPDVPFKVPDTVALGAAFRPSEKWLFGVEYDFVQFSQLMDDVRNTSTASTDPEGLMILERLQVRDAHQIRFGGEYVTVVFGDRLLTLRGGFWYDPQHQPYFRADDPATGLPAPGWALLFPKRDGDAHGSLGLGFATSRHLQFDAAVDIAGSVKTFALSSIWRF